MAGLYGKLAFFYKIAEFNFAIPKSFNLTTDLGKLGVFKVSSAPFGFFNPPNAGPPYKMNSHIASSFYSRGRPCPDA